MTIPFSSSSNTVNSSCSGSLKSKSQAKKPTIRKRHSQTKLQNLVTPPSSLSSIESSETPWFSVVSPMSQNFLDAKRFAFSKASGDNVSPACVVSNRFAGKDFTCQAATLVNHSESAYGGEWATRFVPDVSTLMPDNPLVQRMLQRRREQQVVARSDLPPSMPIKRQSVDCFETMQSFEDPKWSVPQSGKGSDNSEIISWDHDLQSARLAASHHPDCCPSPILPHGEILDVKPRQPRRLESQVSLQASSEASEGALTTHPPKLWIPHNDQGSDLDTPLRPPVRVNTQIAMALLPPKFVSSRQGQASVKPDAPLRQPVRVNTQISISKSES
jgi:hypothetical protein